jgi:hypothetical protein
MITETELFESKNKKKTVNGNKEFTYCHFHLNFNLLFKW